MKQDIRFFFAQMKFNIKNAHALRRSFWTGVVAMMINNLAFFAIWLLFMKATGPINGWTSLDVFGMLGVSLVCFGVTHAFFFGVIELPQQITRGNFDTVLLFPVSRFVRLAGTSFSVTSYGDLLQGIIVVIAYGVLAHFTFLSWMLFVFTLIMGCILFLSIVTLCSLVAFYIHDGEVVARQMFEVFLRPGLYPGAIFPSKLKMFFMTVIPTLLTSAVAIDVLKDRSLSLFLLALFVTLLWSFIAKICFSRAVRRYESGNLLR